MTYTWAVFRRKIRQGECLDTPPPIEKYNRPTSSTLPFKNFSKTLPFKNFLLGHILGHLVQVSFN